MSNAKQLIHDRNQCLAVFKALMSKRPTRKLIWDWLCYANVNNFDLIRDPYEAAYRRGIQFIGSQILDFIQRDPETYLMMVNENSLELHTDKEVPPAPQESEF